MLFLLNISFFETLPAVLVNLIGSNEDTARVTPHLSSSPRAGRRRGSAD